MVIHAGPGYSHDATLIRQVLRRDRADVPEREDDAGLAARSAQCVRRGNRDRVLVDAGQFPARRTHPATTTATPGSAPWS
jgi:hypothetical protein